MLIRDVMTRQLRTVDPGDPLKAAAELMRVHDIGFLPVVHHGRVVGALTDRDLVVRGLAKGLGADADVSDVMSEHVVYAFDDETALEGLERMREEAVRRLLILDRKMNLLGVVSLEDFAAVSDDPDGVQQLLAELG